MVVTSRLGLILSDGRKEYPIEESFVSKVDETTFVAIVTASASIRALVGFAMAPRKLRSGSCT